MKYSEEELKVLRENYSEDFLNNYHRSLEKIDSLEEAMASMQIPEDYGGSYIDEEGNLIICLYKFTSEKKEIYADYCNSDAISVRSVEYSIKYLKAIMNTIETYMNLNQETKVVNNISSLSLKVSLNRIQVGLSVLTEENIKKFKESILDSPALTFIQRDPEKEENSVSPGAALSSGGSVGYRARQNGQAGFIISAHQTSSNATVSLEGYGAVVFKSGKATGLTTGRITDPVYTSSPSNAPTLTNVARASYSSTNGDSGGIVYRPNNSYRFACGIHIRGNGVFCKASVIRDAFNVSRY